MLNSLQKFLVLDLVQSLFSARQRSCLSISSCNYVSGPAQGERLPGRCVAMETRCVTWAFGSHCSVSAVSPCLHGYVSEACVTVLYGELAKRHVAPLPAADKHCRIHLSTMSNVCVYMCIFTRVNVCVYVRVYVRVYLCVCVMDVVV